MVLNVWVGNTEYVAQRKGIGYNRYSQSRSYYSLHYHHHPYPMSLNTVVNNLVRAAAGIPTNISDGDLDKHVAELLAKEAKEREARWSEIGLGGLLGNDKSQ